MTPKAANVSGVSYCAHCGEKIWEDGATGRWFHPFKPCRVTNRDDADLALDTTEVERELAELDRLDREMESL